MLVPASLYGRYKEVLPRCRKMITALKKGRSWEAVVCEEGTLDAQTLPGLLVLDGPTALLGGAPHVQCYLPMRLLRDAVLGGKVTPALESEIFDTSLGTAWGTLGLLSLDSRLLSKEPGRHRLLLEATLRFWPVYEALGARYTAGCNAGEPLWALPTNLKYVLAHMGVSVVTLNSPLPSGGILSLIAGRL